MACFQLANMIKLTAQERQRLLEEQALPRMLSLLTASVLVRIEQWLPEDFDIDDPLHVNLVATLKDAFTTPADSKRLAADFFDQTDLIDVAELVKRASADGQLRALVAHALARRPADDALWQQFERKTKTSRRRSTP
jgi:hypothetical protein